MIAAHSAQLHRRELALTVGASCTLLFCVCLFLAVQLTSRNMLGVASNWFVPDGITLATGFWRFWNGTLPESSYLGSAAINYLYFPALALGLLGFAVVNIGALVVSLSWFDRRARIRDVLLLFPYFILALALPSKDVLTLAMALLLAGSVVRRNILMAFVVALATFLVRDGAAVVATAFVVAWLLMTRFPALRMWIVGACLTGPIAVDSIVRSWFGELFIYARQLNVLELSVTSSRLNLYESGGAGLRVLGNLTNLATRPSIADEAGGIALVGIAYWVSGVALLASAMMSLVFVWRNDNRTASITGLLFFVGVGVVSISPLIQPRYLLPYAAVVMLVHLQTSRARGYRVFLASAAISLIGTFAYMLSPLGLPPANTTAAWSPFWLY